MAFKVPLFPGRVFESLEEYYELLETREKLRKELQNKNVGEKVEIIAKISKNSSEYKEWLKWMQQLEKA